MRVACRLRSELLTSEISSKMQAVIKKKERKKVAYKANREHVI